MEDRRGLLLIATDRGISRFDGYNFETLYLNNTKTVTPVFDIYAASSGSYYFPGLKGQLYTYRDFRLSPYKYNSKIATSDSNGGFLIADAVFEHRGSLYVKYNNNLNTFTRIDTSGRLSREQVAAGIHFDLARGFLYKTFSEQNLENTVQPVYITWPDGTRTADSVRLSWQAGYIRSPYHIRDGETDVFCIGRQLLLFRGRKASGRYTLPRDALCLAKLANGEISVGLQNGGVAVYRLEGSSLTGPVRSFLSPLSVSSIYKDFQGGIWFATLEDGLYYCFPSGAALWQYGSQIVFMASHGDTAFVALQNGIVHRLVGGVSAEAFQLPLRTGEQLFSISFDLHGKPIVSSTLGFYMLQQKGWEFHAGRDKLIVQTDPDTAYGAGIVDATLNKYSIREGRLLRSIRMQKRILTILRDTSRGIWLGTMEGLYHFDETHGLQNAGRAHPALQDRIVALRSLPDGGLAIATLSSGLVLWRRDGIRVFSTANGLSTPIINDMCVVGNAVWLSTNSGLSELELSHDSVSIRHYSSEYGLPTLDIQAFTISGNWLYFKWINSAVAINLHRLREFRGPAAVFITGVYLNGRRLEERHVLNHREHDLVFAFNSINFASGTRQRYRCRLHGFDPRWRSTGERQVAYNNLEPGQYNFEVQVADASGSYRAAAAGFAITIQPAFWQRWWFILFLILAFAFLVYGFVRLRIRAIRRRNELLLALAENQQKALTQMISPHFIFNILNTAQAFILSEDKMKAASFISRIAKLLRLSLEVGKERYIAFETELSLLTKYLELEESRVHGRFSYRIDVSPEVQQDKIIIPGMLVQPFVENAIKHGLMHLQERHGAIAVGFAVLDGRLLCTVEDNGIGRDRARDIYAIGQPGHKSVGIELTKRRLELLHQEHKSNHLFEIQDIYSAEGQPGGTRVVFSIPYTLRA
jgi:two-component sensor histidine kinase